MQRLSRSLSRFETQDIKTQPQFNHYLFLNQKISVTGMRFQDEDRNVTDGYYERTLMKTGGDGSLLRVNSHSHEILSWRRKRISSLSRSLEVTWAPETLTWKRSGSAVNTFANDCKKEDWIIICRIRKKQITQCHFTIYKLMAGKEKLQLQKRRQQRRRPTRRWKKCNPVRKKNKEL